MRKMLTNVLTVIALVLVGGLSSCMKDQTEAVPSLEVGTPVVNSAVSVDVPLRVSALQEIAYQVLPVDEAAPANALIVFKNGTVVGGGTSVLRLTAQDGLVKGAEFTVYVAARVSASEFFDAGRVQNQSFVTPNNYTEQVQVLRATDDGADVYVTFPHEICGNCSRVRWGMTNLGFYSMMSQSMVEAITLNDAHYPASIISADTLLQLNNYNRYRRDADGNVLWVDWEGNTYVEGDPNMTPDATAIDYYPEMLPGTPLVLMLAEAEYADGVNVMPTVEWAAWSFGPGWYKFPFDLNGYTEALYSGGGGHVPMQEAGAPAVNEDDYWYPNAWHKRVEFTLPAPAKSDAEVKVEFSNMSSAGGKITFKPGSNGKAFASALAIFPEESEYGLTWNQVVDMFLSGKEEHMQWLSTSEVGWTYAGFTPIYYRGTQAYEMLIYSDNYDDNAYFELPLKPGVKCHLILNTIEGKYENGDYVEDFTKQNYQHIEFTIPDYTMPTPELEVIPVEAYSPWEVKFIVKNPNYASNPVTKVNYAAEYARTYDIELSFGYTYSMLCEYGQPFTDSEVRQINSAKGLEVAFPSKDNAATRMAVMGWNKENRPSDPDAEGSKAVAEARSLPEPDAERVEFTKINGLEGEWTATATVRNYEWGDEGPIYPESQVSWKVVIGDTSSPAALTQDVYDLYEQSGVTKEQTDAYFAQFKDAEATYNKSVRGQNRVLCQGLGYASEQGYQITTPWDLFISSDYAFGKVEYLFEEFGAKWFLQEDAEGNVFIPVNINRVDPLSTWTGSIYHFVAACSVDGMDYAAYAPTDEYMDDVSKWPNMPVEVSADKQTITLKSVAYDDNTYYPNAVYESYGYTYLYYPHVISEIVLTKGWNGAEDGVASVKKQSTTAVQSVNGAKIEVSTAARGARRVKVLPKIEKAERITNVHALSKAEMYDRIRKAVESKKVVRK